MEIRTKRQFYSLWRAGVLGNKPREWSLETFKAEPSPPGSVSVRELGAVGGGRCEYRVKPSNVSTVVAQWGSPQVSINESAPDEKLILQGEILRDGEWYLRYSTLPLPMRQALRDAPRDAYGLGALSILRWALNPSTFGDIEDLLELYPDHVVEFGAYRCLVGSLPGRNAFIWEVRKY
jgi:hypothetical protein